jgi:hypothetical protein
VISSREELEKQAESLRMTMTKVYDECAYCRVHIHLFFLLSESSVL